MKRALVGAIGLIGAVALAVALVRTMTRTARTVGQDIGAGGQPPGDRQEIARLQAQVVVLQGRLAAKEAACTAPTAEAASAKPVVAQDDSREVRDPTPPPTGGGGHPDDSFAALEARARGESPDPTWSGPTEQTLWASAAALQPIGSLDRVHCGQDLCRLDIHHGRDPSALARVTRWAEALDNFSSERVLRTDPAGETTTLWLARAGGAMPMAGGGGEMPATVANDPAPNPFGKSSE